MSTAKKSGGGPKKPANTGPDQGSTKKNKSKGFIESSDFKPNWLETGPLSPDMLPDPRESEGENLTDEFAALQAALQRYYGQEPADAAAVPAPMPTEPAAAQELSDVQETSAAEELTVTDEMAVEAPPTLAAAPPPEWLAVLLAEVVPLETLPRTGPLPPPPPPEALTFIEEEPPVIEPPVMSEARAFVEEAPPAVEPVVLVDELPPAGTPAPLSYDAGEPSLEVVTTAELAEEALAGEPRPLAESVQAVELIPTVTESVADSPPPVVPTADAGLTPPLSQAVVEPIAPAPKPARAPRVRRRAVQRPSRLASALFVLSLLLLAAAAFIYFVNPVTRLALGTATLARPSASPDVFPPRNASGDWCLVGEGLSDGDPLRLVDDGTQGDVLAEDNAFSLQYVLAAPGIYQWQVADCANPSIVYPPAPAWLTTQQANQPVTFMFDPTERADPLFFPISYVVSALDQVESYQVVGSFQEWNADDPSAKLQRVNSGLYQQVRRIARSGSYEAYIIGDAVSAEDVEQAIDAYGRTIEPIPFSFETTSNGEYVVFLLDIDRGRASVLYRMPSLLTRLAFGGGYRLLSGALLGLAVALLALLLLRALILRNRKLWIESGCPRCHEHELMRIARQSGDRWLHLLGIPAYRYRCRACVWEGRRLSSTGESISPGATIAHIRPLD